MKKQIEFKQTKIKVIPEEWEVKELGEVCQLVKKQYSPSKKDVRAYIGLEHIKQQNLKLINIGSSEEIDSIKLEFKAGQILFGKLRPYFRKVYRPKFDGVCSTDIWVIDSKGQFDNGFLFYFLADQRIINVANNSSEGTRMPRARWDYLSRLKFAFPSIGERRAIAFILGFLDDKIALSRSMNTTLEAIGQALFKHWFVDFEFPDKEGKPYRSSGGEMVETELGEAPRGWIGSG
jgi:type I restriction enzyme S subunit